MMLTGGGIKTDRYEQHGVIMHEWGGGGDGLMRFSGLSCSHKKLLGLHSIAAAWSSRYTTEDNIGVSPTAFLLKHIPRT